MGQWTYLDKPDSAMARLEHDMFIRIWLRVFVIGGSKGIERFLLVFDSSIIHSEIDES